MDKQKRIEKMATYLHGNACGGNCNNKTCHCSDYITAERLVNRGYEDVTEFAKRILDAISKNIPISYSFINHLLEEYLNG